jgi:hypothetical protein
MASCEFNGVGHEDCWSQESKCNGVKQNRGILLVFTMPNAWLMKGMGVA